MKKYKLKSDIPGHKAGEVFELTYDGAMLDPDGVTAYTASDIQDHPDIMDWFEEVKGSWMPEFGEGYWFVGDDGSMHSRACHGDEYDLGRRTHGNVFHTQEEAEKHRKWLEAVAVLRADTANQPTDWKNADFDKWQVYYNHPKERLVACAYYEGKHAPFVFNNVDDAQRSIAEHEAEWRTFLGVE